MDIKKKILLISQYFAPESIVGAKRMSFLSYYLEQNGFDVDVLTSTNKHLNNNDDTLYGGKVHRVVNVLPIVNPHSFVKRVINKLWSYIAPVDIQSAWLFKAYYVGKKIIKTKKTDYILVSAPYFSSFLLAYLLSCVCKTKLILDYRDPWFPYYENKNLRNRINNKFEKILLQKSHKVVFNTSEAKQYYVDVLDRVDFEKKAFVINNAFDSIFEGEVKQLDSTKFKVVYAGNFYGTRGLSNLIYALDKLRKDGCFKSKGIAIHVFGNVTSYDLDIVKQLNWKDLIVMHNQVPYNEIRSFLSCADILYLSQGPEHWLSVPYKFFDYLSVGRPIFAITPDNSALANIININSLGVSSSPVDRDGIIDSLKYLLFENYEFPQVVASQYTWKAITDKYIEMFRE